MLRDMMAAGRDVTRSTIARETREPLAPTIAGWFSRVGVALHDDERTSIARLLDASDATFTIEVVTGAALSRVLFAEEHDNLWWDADEGERERLWDEASNGCTEDEIASQLAALSACRVEVSAAAKAVETIALDATVVGAAIESAMLALHHHLLAELASAPAGHWFRIKLALFESGRWPLGFRAGRFYVV